MLVVLDLGVHLNGVAIECPPDVLAVGVETLGVIVLPRPDFVLVGLFEQLFLGSGSQIDWRLVGATTLVVFDHEVWPVGTVVLVFSKYLTQ